MMAQWPTLQTVAESTDPVSNRQTRSFGQDMPNPVACDFHKDVEGQPTGVVGTRRAGVTPTTTPVSPGMDDREASISIYTFLKIVTALSALYMASNPWIFFYDADKEEICPYTVICATNPVELALLTGSRLSAGVLFASLTISIISKCYATRSFLHHSWLGAVVDFEPSHDIHTYFGFLSMMAALEHGLLHCIRFAHAKQTNLIYDTDTGRSGVIGCFLLLPIVLPMKFESLKTKMSFQFRKGLHLLFLPLLVALCFHSVIFRYVGSIFIVWYILDRFYFTTRQTFLIDHPVFEAVGRGTMVVLDVPAGYTFKAGSYIYVNSPSISRSEWHPFSIIQVPGVVPRATFYAEAVGDWTQELFRLGLEKPRLPLWITAAQPSLMEKSIYYDNVVLVCTGAGITPAVSIIERFSTRKNIHLVWMSRDGGMVALFENQLRKVNSTVHLTGVQTDDTKAALTGLLQPLEKNEASMTGRMSFGSVIDKDFTKMMPSTTPMARPDGDDSGEEIKSTTGDTGEIRALPPRHSNVNNTTGQSRDSTLRHNRSKRIRTEPKNPVTLIFGRPDIGGYLTETFAMQTRAPRPGRPTGRNSDDRLNDTSASVSDIKTAAGLPGVQKCKRLDADQTTFKETLMKADPKVVEAWHQQRTAARNKAVKSNDITPCTSSNSLSSGCPLPWLVLYCGANPKVEEAIAKTCDDLHVKWQKEYFGAW